MKLPSADKVQIDERKVRGYLLSRSHPVGRFKARVFAAVGFDESTAAAFIAELRRIALAGEVSEAEEMEFGRKYTVPGCRFRKLWHWDSGNSGTVVDPLS